MPLPTTNDFTGRIWRIVTTGTSPLANVKIKGGTWTGGTAGTTFSMVDIAGREYDWIFPSGATSLTFEELGWLSGPVTFTAVPGGQVLFYLATGK